MKIPLLVGRHTIFMRVLCVFLIVIFPLYALSIYTNIRGQKDVREELVHSAKANLHFYAKSLEKDIYNIIKAQSSLINDPNIRRAVGPADSLGDMEQYQVFNGIRDDLIDLKESNSYVQDATVYLFAQQLVISNTTIHKMTMEHQERINSLSVRFPFSTDGKDLYINISPQALNTSRIENTSFLASVRLSKTKITGFLNSLGDREESSALLVGDESGLNIAPDNIPGEMPEIRAYIRQREQTGEKVGAGTINTSKGAYTIVFEKLNTLHTTLIWFIREDKFTEPVSRFKLWIWTATGVTLVMVVFFGIWLRGVVATPLKKLLKAFAKVEKGELDIAVRYSKDDEFGHLYTKFNSMFQKLNSLIQEVYEQKIYAQQAELKQLQYQISPHFLYNSLLILYNLIRIGDNECAGEMTQHLRSYYQYITRSGSEEVHLHHEVNHIRDYTAIQQIRFSNRIRIEIGAIPEGKEEFMVPRLIIQPFVENAFNHGLRKKMSDGRLRIGFEASDHSLAIRIEDNGEELSKEKLEEIRRLLSGQNGEEEHTALLNVHRRLQIKFGDHSGVFVSRGEWGGLLAEIRILY